MALVLDAGALVAVDRRDRAVGAMLRVAQQEAIPVRTSAAVVAQVWRDGRRQANLARVLAGVDAVALDPPTGREVGHLLGRSATADVVDGHLGLIVLQDDTVLTSDPDDVGRLLRARSVAARVRRV
ncbi:MAG: hypothetical protein ACRDYD_08295 [Acidimicrobiales bacterium]